VSFDFALRFSSTFHVLALAIAAPCAAMLAFIREVQEQDPMSRSQGENAPLLIFYNCNRGG
jgi:hypothetical protein